MSNLRLINETSATDVASFSVTDVFSADFDIYKVIVSQDTSAGNAVKTQLINSSGSIITSSNYDIAMQQIRSNTTGAESKATNTSYMQLFLQGTNDTTSTIYFFNPFSSSSYTFGLGQSTGYYGGAGIPTLFTKSIGVLKNTSSCTGFALTPLNPNFTDITVKTYGLRVDS